jgi:hypothetical protein
MQIVRAAHRNYVPMAVEATVVNLDMRANLCKAIAGHDRTKEPATGGSRSPMADPASTPTLVGRSASDIPDCIVGITMWRHDKELPKEVTRTTSGVLVLNRLLGQSK